MPFGLVSLDLVLFEGALSVLFFPLGAESRPTGLGEDVVIALAIEEGEKAG